MSPYRRISLAPSEWALTVAVAVDALDVAPWALHQVERVERACGELACALSHVLGERRRTRARSRAHAARPHLGDSPS